jgi:RNA polymerase sigma-70 factor (ECF subfamily)
MTSDHPENPDFHSVPSDHSLLRRLREGNQDAAAELYERYVERLRALTRANRPAALSRTLDVDDIVQSVFANFFQKAGQGEYDVPAGEELWKLFLVMALNKIRAKSNYYLAEKRDVRLTMGGDTLKHYANTELEVDAAEEAFLEMVIDETLEKLPESHGPIIRLRTEGYEVAEIAEKLGRAQRTVERILQNFRRRMTDMLRPEE